VGVSEGHHNRQRLPVQERRFQTGLSPLAGETLADRQLSPPVQPDGEAEPRDQEDPPHSSPDVPNQPWERRLVKGLFNLRRRRMPPPVRRPVTCSWALIFAAPANGNGTTVPSRSRLASATNGPVTNNDDTRSGTYNQARPSQSFNQGTWCSLLVKLDYPVFRLISDPKHLRQCTPLSERRHPERGNQVARLRRRFLLESFRYKWTSHLSPEPRLVRVCTQTVPVVTLYIN
jgi:hypothetical protein